MTDRLFDFGYVVIGALLASLYPAYRNWRSDAKAEGAASADLQTLAKTVGRLEQRADDQERDIAGVATAGRALHERHEKRIVRLEKRDAVMETAVTGKMPRASGENEASND